jgi:TolB-like protein/class 3 adenylate cyclase/Flp pilus assembly protein TadD
MEKRLPRKLAAILYADVVGYSRLTGEDEDSTHRRLTEYFDQIAVTVDLHGGRVMHYAGDAVLAMFEAVVDALSCAAQIQSDLKTRNGDLPDERKVQFRIGLNLGDVIEDRDDIYGDGVNVAARLESLAAPGGICLSESVYTAVSNKLPFDYEFMGEQEVKNIAQPVKAYHAHLKPDAVVPEPRGAARTGKQMQRAIVAAVVIVLVVVGGVLTWLKPWEPGGEPASIERMAFPLPDKPSIAVLPFINMSDDAKQEYFVDGMTEDLITDLSKLSGLFVISRNSTFIYKGKAVEVRQVAEDLGVRYVLEGSVRRVEDQIRVNAQLIDATTGGHLWANRYDGQLDNIFALQDRITKKIFDALAVELSAGEQEKLGRKETNNIEAYDAFLKGWEHYRRWTADDFRKALPYFQRAIELDPHYGRANAAIASIYTEGYQKAWDWSHVVGVSAEAMPGLAGEYLKEALKNPTPLAHQVASKWYVILLFSEESIAEAARAIALDPNDAVGYAAMATALIYSGKSEEAIDFVGKAMRFDPHNMPNYLFTLGMAYFGMEQFQQAVSVFERAFKFNPELGLVQRAYLAAAYVHLGQEEKAMAELDKPEIKEVRELYDLYVKYEGAYYKNPEDTARLIEGLRKIGSGRDG